MTEFKPINTQEEFNEAIRERLARETAKYSDYEDIKKKNGEYEQKISGFAEEKAGLEKMVAELTSKNKAYETNSVKMRTALEMGLPTELAERLAGDTEEDIKKDAKKLADLFKANAKPEPMANREENNDRNQTDVAFKEMLKNLK